MEKNLPKYKINEIKARHMSAIDMGDNMKKINQTGNANKLIFNKNI
jgi:hypothetical protein